MTKVLIVIDDDFRFAPPEAPGGTDFTFITLVNALVSGGYDVTKANRQPDTTATPGFDNFTFNNLAQLLPYDVIWLIAHEGRNTGTPGPANHDSKPLPESELAAIAAYMDAGGGVFAVGDHDSVGSVMCGQLPRIRVMRSWYGDQDAYARCSDTEPPTTVGHNWTGQPIVGPNFPQITQPSLGRADTIAARMLSSYPPNASTPYIWFENQSDSTPQTITPVAPTHPILRSGGADVVVFPDHMHEGNTLEDVPGYDYTTTLTFNGQSFTEFPAYMGPPEKPKVIATGHSNPNRSLYVDTGTVVDANLAGSADVNILSVYNGRNVGVGRIVTGSTFHHYIDINLAGASGLTMAGLALVGADAQKTHGLGDAPAAMTAITDVYRNITQWLARPTPALQIILERSTFSQDEATASSTFDHAILVTVDGLKFNQFPAGGIPALGPVPAGPTPAWAPQVALPDPSVIRIDLVSVDSDDHVLAPVLQRFTFTYRVNFLDVSTAFNFPGPPAPPNLLPVTATLASPATAAPLTDSADIELIKSANPFMLDLDNGNTTAWLSSDVKVFPVVAGVGKLGGTWPAGDTHADALTFLQSMLTHVDIPSFVGLDPDEEGSALSPFPTTTGTPTKNVYNFAIARVRVGKHAAPADVRVAFRIVPSPTTASLTFQAMGTTPIGSYRQTAAADPIPLPGQDGAGSTWLSFPCFASGRMLPPATQTDMNTLKTLPINMGGEQSFFYGALIDNNLMEGYLPSTPSAADGPFSLSTLMMGEHQCLVAQVMYSGAPIPNGANPATSDKLSQRNLAFSAVANPGLDASRMAMHTFEIEATPTNSLGFRPDELLLQWTNEPPGRTTVDIFIPTWDAQAVVDLADRLYPRHEITVVDAQTVSVPGGGTKYIPIPPGAQRQTGVISAQFPLGVVKGLRFDLSVRQITTRSRGIDLAGPKTTRISLEEAAKLLERHGTQGASKGKAAKAPPHGVFDLGGHKTLITDLRVVDGFGDHALVVEHVPPEKLAEAKRAAGAWRETIGAFQLAVPVSDKASMLPHHLRLLSVMRWRAEHLPQRGGRWNKTFLRYVEMLAEKVRALGGDPYKVPPTPDGSWDGLYGPGGTGGAGLLPGDGGLGHVAGGGLAGLAHGAATGKIASLFYGHFGDFDGFVLETFSGHLRRYLSHEERIEHLAREAWQERYVVTVWSEPGEPAEVRELAFGQPD
jgi:hypothetical protein